MTSTTGGVLGTVIVRAWIEPEGTVSDLRARVLVVRSTQDEFEDIGVAAGFDAVLALVAEGLRSVGEPAAR